MTQKKPTLIVDITCLSKTVKPSLSQTLAEKMLAYQMNGGDVVILSTMPTSQSKEELDHPRIKELFKNKEFPIISADDMQSDLFKPDYFDQLLQRLATKPLALFLVAGSRLMGDRALNNELKVFNFYDVSYPSIVDVSLPS